MNHRIGSALFSLSLLCVLPGCPDSAPAPLGGESLSPNTSNQNLVRGLALPQGANAVVSVAGVTAHLPGSTARHLGDGVDAEVVIESALLIIRDIKLVQFDDPNDMDDDPNDMDDDPNDMDDDPNDMNDDPNDMSDPNDPAARGFGHGDDDHGSAVKLVGPFLVDLVNETTENLGLSNIDDDADDDGISDDADDDDDNDGVPDDADDDDDGDGIPDADDQVMGKCKIFDAMSLPPGTYRFIKFKLHRLDAEELGLMDHPMDGLSVMITGTIDGVPFVYRSRFTENFKFKSQEGIDVVDGEISTFLLTIDVASWFASLDVSTAHLEMDGSIVMEFPFVNPHLALQVRLAAKGGCHFGRHDGKRGDDDDDHGDDDGDDEEDDDADDDDADDGDDDDSDDDDGSDDDD